MSCTPQGFAVLCREIGDKASSSGHHLFGNSKQPAVSSATVPVDLSAAIINVRMPLRPCSAESHSLVAICLLLCQKQGHNLAHADSCEANSLGCVGAELPEEADCGPCHQTASTAHKMKGRFRASCLI